MPSLQLNPRDRTLVRIATSSLIEERLLPESGPLLAGVSGGPDSVALLHFLVAHHGRTGRPSGGIVVGHVNHGLRGAASEGDAAFVRELSARLGLVLFEERVAPMARSGPAEGAARRVRYACLKAIAARAGADRVAMAHTADDQAETVLFRMIRGAGLRGLGGMRPRGRVHGLTVIRPLLHVTRSQVIDHLGRHGLSYRTDASNDTTGPARNYLRLEVMPRLAERLNPSLRATLLREAELLRGVDSYLRSEAARVLDQVRLPDAEGKLALDARALLLYPKPLQAYLFRRVVEEWDGALRDLAKAHIDSLLSLVATPRGRTVDLPNGLAARRTGGRVIVGPRIEDAPRPARHLKGRDGDDGSR